MEANRFVPLMAALFLVGAGCRTEPGGATKAKHESSTCEAVQSTVLPRTGLHYAARIGDVRRALLAHHADVNARNRDNDAPIHVAAKRQERAFVDFLLDKGAQFDYTVTGFFRNGPR